MNDFWIRYKPGASRRTHLLVTAFIWSMVGIFLMARAENIFLEVVEWWWLLPLAALFGVLKSHFILDRVARKNIDRIVNLQDRTCIGAAYSWKTWGVILSMIVFGRLIRQADCSPLFMGLIYWAIGWALFWSSRLIWHKWQEW